MGPSLWTVFLMAQLFTDVLTKDFMLTVLHTNDVHARIDEFDAKGSRCTPELSADNKCYGGIARHRYIAEKLRADRPNATIFLNAGDYFQGTMWYFHLKANIIADVIDLLRHDAITLGNHEFDDGSEGLLPLLIRAKKIGTPVLACNVDFTKNDILRDYQPVPSIVLERSGVKIGIIGYLTPETTFLSAVDNYTIMTDEIECITKEAKKMNDEGIKIIIATGHSGYIKDMEIARAIPAVKMVVGAHSHSFLTSTAETNGDSVKGPYPTVITRKDNTKALVVQDFWLGKYFGYINVTFDTETGDVKSWQGDSPLLLDYTVPKDPEVEKFVVGKRDSVDEKGNEIVGTAIFAVSGDKDDCRFTECAMGDMIADSYTEYFVSEYKKDEMSDRWNYIDISVINGGAIRGSLPNGSITFSDVVTVSPFSNQLWVIEMNGARVKKMMEAGVKKYDKTRLQSYGGFLHYSGARVVLNVDRPVGQRVVSVEVLSSMRSNIKWEPLDLEKVYRIGINSYIANGGDNHDFSDIPSSKIEKTRMTDTDCLEFYIKRKSPIHPVTDQRMRFVDESKSAASLPTFSKFLAALCLFTVLSLKCF